MSENPYAAPQSAIPVKGKGSELASLMERFLGALIDAIIMMVISLPLSFLLIVPMFFESVSEVSYFSFNLGYTVVSTLFGIGIFLAIQGYPLATRGQTIGKIVMKTRIVSEQNGQILPFGPLFLKRYLVIWLLGLIPIAGGIIGLVNVLLIFRENRHCLHDDIAGTKVIKVT